MLAEERAGQSRRLQQVAIRALEAQDRQTCDAIPLITDVVIREDLAMRVQIAAAERDDDDFSPTHVHTHFGGLQYSTSGFAGRLYTSSVSEHVGTTLGPFQLISDNDLDQHDSWRLKGHAPSPVCN